MQHFITWASRINTLHASVSYGYSAIRRSALIIFSGLKPASYNQSMYTFQATETSEQYEELQYSSLIIYWIWAKNSGTVDMCNERKSGKPSLNKLPFYGTAGQCTLALPKVRNISTVHSLNPHFTHMPYHLEALLRTDYSTDSHK